MRKPKPYKITAQMLRNDLAAAHTRNGQLQEACDKLRKDHALQAAALIEAYRERDDWRDAFKLIMKLVK